MEGTREIWNVVSITRSNNYIIALNNLHAFGTGKREVLEKYYILACSPFGNLHWITGYQTVA